MDVLTKIELSDAQIRQIDHGQMVVIAAEWDEFMDFLETTTYRAEYYNGHIIIMGLAKFIHEALVANFIFILKMLYRGRGFYVTGSNVGLIKENKRGYHNADVLVVKGAPEFWKSSEAIITNPHLVVEVLSDSMARYDLNTKRQAYKSFETLVQIVLIDPIEREIHTSARTENTENWLDTTYTALNEVVKIDGFDVSFSSVFENLPC
jgi:Uma2 family endonuclease